MLVAIEILLWNIVVILGFSVSIYFYYQYKTRSDESRPFYLGVQAREIRNGKGRRSGGGRGNSKKRWRAR